MNARQILDEALKLTVEDRFAIVTGLLESIDEPDKRIDEIWLDEAEKRLKAYREGRLEGILLEEITSVAAVPSSRLR